MSTRRRFRGAWIEVLALVVTGIVFVVPFVQQLSVLDLSSQKIEVSVRSGSSRASCARSARSASRHPAWSIDARTWLLKSQYGHLLTQNGQWT